MIWQKELRLLIFFLIAFVAVTLLVSSYFILKIDSYVEEIYQKELEAEIAVVKYFIEAKIPLVELPSTPLISSIVRTESSVTTGDKRIINVSGQRFAITANRDFIGRLRYSTRLYLLFIAIICLSVVILDLYFARRTLLQKTGDVSSIGQHTQSLSQFVDEAIDRLKEKEMIVTKMATIVSHELKNSLSTIMGLIRSGGVEEKKLNHEIKRMLEFLDRISLFTRPIKVKNELICLNYLILDVLQDFRTATETVLEFNSSDELRITTDPVILEHILKNIIKNSIDALDGRGKIQIDLEKKPEKVSISIADDGPGIPPEDLKKIFQPFYTTKPDGTGLGLAIVKRFSEAIGAEVSVSSKPGRGTRFILELPNV